jgi:Plavaka transposase
VSDSELPYLKNDNWKEGVIKIPLPLAWTQYASEDDAHLLEVKFVYQSLGEVVKSGIQDFASLHNFHWHGFKQFWQPSEGEPEQQVYGKVYTTDTFLEMEHKLPDIARCMLEKAIVPLLGYSDLTHLANFGTALLWPIYIWFGNISKYIRIKALLFVAYHLAYLPSVSIRIHWAQTTTALHPMLTASIDPSISPGSLYRMSWSCCTGVKFKTTKARSYAGNLVNATEL